MIIRLIQTLTSTFGYKCSQIQLKPHRIKSKKVFFEKNYQMQALHSLVQWNLLLHLLSHSAVLLFALMLQDFPLAYDQSLPVVNRNLNLKTLGSDNTGNTLFLKNMNVGMAETPLLAAVSGQ